MDAVERLSTEEAGGPTLIALTHVHRYEVAAELCAELRVLDLACGSGYGSRMLARSARQVTGVDVHQPSIDRAIRDAADEPNLRFECSDAQSVLDRELTADFDAVVLFEGLEHLRNLDAAIDALRRHVAAGLMVIVSLPNSLPFGEENPDHISEFDLKRATEAFERIGASVMLYQFHAEGSLIRSAEDGPITGSSMLSERAELEHCNHMIAIANPSPRLADSGAWARLRLGVAPTFNTYMLDLERANQRLWRTNQQLARQQLGIADSAAAATLDRLHRRVWETTEAPPGLVRRVAGRLKRALAYVLPHGLVVLQAKLRAAAKRKPE
jgi:2-polyprenyl-3-methyl-5-hydroxy-6-metoxy-1,4-benzoquinol methylase